MNRFLNRRMWMLVAAFAVMLLTASVASACPGCKDALAENDPEQNSLVKGYMYSIMFMLSVPAAILSGFTAYMYLLVRRARAERAATSDGGVMQAARATYLPTAETVDTCRARV